MGTIPTESKIAPEKILPYYHYKKYSSITNSVTKLMETKTMKLFEIADGICIFRLLLQD